jgi:hypothetical protein
LNIEAISDRAHWLYGRATAGQRIAVVVAIEAVSVSGEFTIENLDAKHGVATFQVSMF